jgi:hypothetical protein
MSPLSFNSSTTLAIFESPEGGGGMVSFEMLLLSRQNNFEAKV